MRLGEASRVIIGIFRGIHREMSGRELWRRGLAFFSILVAFWVFDPIGVATNADNASAALFYRVVAPMYPDPLEVENAKREEDPDCQEGAKHENDPKCAIRNIKVVLTNDASLRQIRQVGETDKFCVVPEFDKQDGYFCPDLIADMAREEFGKGPEGKKNISLKRLTWPPPFALHTAILEKIVGTLPPKALFIDFGFFDERKGSNVAMLRSFLCRHALRQTGMQLFASRAYRDNNWDCPKAAMLADEAASRIPVFLTAAAPRRCDFDDKKPDCTNVLPQLAAAASGMASTRYIAEDPQSFNLYPRYDCEIERPSAALVMYGVKDPLAPFEDFSCDSLTKGKPISVFWATWGSEESSRGSFRCATMSSTVIGRLWDILYGWLAGTVRGLADQWFGDRSGWPSARDSFLITKPLRQICPPHETISAHEFLSDTQGADLEFDGAYAFYGGNFTMADDLIRPPTHGLLPGVQLHAMALDNLLRDQDRAGNDRLEIFLMLAAMAVAAVWHTYITNARRVTEAKRDLKVETWIVVQALYALIWTLSAFALLLFFTWFGFFVLKLTPINFVGIIVATSVPQFREFMLWAVGRSMKAIKRWKRKMFWPGAGTWK